MQTFNPNKIAFRGKCISTLQWVLGSLLNDSYYDGENDVKDFFIENKEIYARVIPETLGQFTGAYDVRTLPVFHGDIVSFSPQQLTYVGKVEWSEQHLAFMISNIKCQDQETAFSLDPCYLHTHINSVKVIGNIFDNPELLQQ